MGQQKNIWLIIIFVLLIVIIYLIQVSLSNKNQTTSTENKELTTFTTITSQKLSEMLLKKDFALIDVHIPEQVHIPETDYMIPYNDIETFTSIFPNKNAKIVLYCRSGSMSKVMAEALVKKGYTNIFDLTGGMNEWLAKGRDSVAKGSIPKGVSSKN